MATSSSGPRASETAERFVKQLNVVFKAVRLYPPSSAIPRESASSALATLHAMLRNDPDVRLVITREGFFHDDGAVQPGQAAFVEFAKEFFNRRLAEVRFHLGTTVTEFIEFLRVLDVPRQELIETGGFESRLWDAGVVNITVREASVRIVDHDGIPEEAEEGWPPEPQTIDEIIATVSAGRPRDQRVLVRVVGSPEVLGTYLREAAKGRGTTPSAAWVTSRMSALANMVDSLDPDKRISYLRDLAEGLMELDEETLRDVLAGRMLGEARHDDALAGVIRQVGLDRICSVLASGLDDTPESQEGLTRAFRNLIHLSDMDKGDILAAAGAALVDQGIPDDVATEIVRDAAPERIQVREVRHDEDHLSVEKIIRIVDMTPEGVPGASEDEEIEALTREAREGITDGDVLRALVTLITIERRDDKFGSLMAIVEDSLGLLVTRQEYDVAATVADSLVQTADDAKRPEPQRVRVRNALDALASKPNIRAVVAAMRRYPQDSSEHEACRRLLSVLGGYAMSPLLEVLADEPDMTARKALVVLISEMAEEHIEELGGCLSDERWYFVRNVVTILGATKAPATLSLLGRTLRYRDTRVRRETVRAVASIRDARSTEMLVAALDDSDMQNVQVAARYLGLLGGRAAISPLERVASGRGTGNRDTPVRIEAIEALGRLGAASALPMLRSLAKARGIRARTRSREMAAAADVAIRTIEAHSARESGVAGT